MSPRFFVATIGGQGFGQDSRRTPIKANYLIGPFPTAEEAEAAAADREGWGEETLVLVPRKPLAALADDLDTSAGDSCPDEWAYGRSEAYIDAADRLREIVGRRVKIAKANPAAEGA